jgi:NAD(P)H-quinone oxidoreductase subunit 5
MWNLVHPWLLGLALAAGPLAAMVALARRTWPDRATARAGRVLGVGAASAVALAVAGVLGEETSVGLFTATAFPALVLVLVLGMGATVLSFSARALRDEPYQLRFTVTGSLLVAAGAVLATTTDLVVLALAWVATSVATIQLVRTGPEQGVRRRSLRIQRAFACSDVVIVIAIGALIVATGSTAVADSAAAPGGVAALAGVLLVVAAAARSAVAPFHRWLPDTLGAPTPSSALLHAGVVSGGAIVLIKLAPVVAPQLPAAALALILGGLSCAFAEAVMLTRPDVKGRLAWSTTAQLSFTLVLCGLGLTTAAALHLVAHGFYKGALFLSSGGAVRSLVRARTAPPGPMSASVAPTVVAYTTTALAAAAVVVLSGTDPGAGVLVPVGLAWFAGGRATAGWLRRTTTTPQRLGGVSAGAAAVAAFAALTMALKERVGPSIEVGDAALHPALVVTVLLALAAVALTRQVDARPHGALDRAWTAVREAGRPVAPRPLLRPAPTPVRLDAPSAAPSPTPDHSLIGG